jgi:hypothetical protein
MLSGQLAINRGAEPSGPLIAPGKKAVAEVERQRGGVQEQEEVQGACASRKRRFVRLTRHLLDISRGGSSPIGWQTLAAIGRSRCHRETTNLRIPEAVPLDVR